MIILDFPWKMPHLFSGQSHLTRSWFICAILPSKIVMEHWFLLWHEARWNCGWYYLTCHDRGETHTTNDQDCLKSLLSNSTIHWESNINCLHESSSSIAINTAHSGSELGSFYSVLEMRNHGPEKFQYKEMVVSS